MKNLETEYEKHYVPLREEVKAMFDQTDKLRDKAIIAFLAQTGQRIGVLTAVKHEHYSEVGTHLVVDVSPTYPNQLGINVNKERVRYKFVIGEDASKLLKELKKSPSPWVFDLSLRQMERVVDEAARRIGVQKETVSTLGRKQRLIHAHTFRKYWKHQVREPLGDSDLVNYMMGHKEPYRGAYDHFIDNRDLVERYMKAERNLRIIYTREMLCPKCSGNGEIQCDTCAGKGLVA